MNARPLRLAFAVVAFGVFDRATTLITLPVLLLAQIAAHFRFFLHIDPWKLLRDDLMLILFTALITPLMVSGAPWILFDEWSRMM